MTPSPVALACKAFGGLAGFGSGTQSSSWSANRSIREEADYRLRTELSASGVGGRRSESEYHFAGVLQQFSNFKPVALSIPRT